jgi:MFS family permease
VADRFGRKKATVIFLGLFSIFSVVFNILMENYPPFWLSIWQRYVIYCIFQLLSGILSCCLQISLYVHLIEFTTDDYHILVSNVTSYFYIGGEIFVLVVFYFSRSWTVTNWYITIFSVVTLIPFCLFIPESPR